ncbi:MAG TPA: nuclease-related domain-containing protein [Coriobacteriia bacterium]|nr:nuclease-related domain-containing protein [Coriobacteriia bacterium]
MNEGDHPANAAIAAELARLASVYGFTPLSGLNLRHQSGSAVVDHAIVDEFGVLVFSTLTCGSAVLRGSDTDARWTVRFDDGAISTLVNPLTGLRNAEKIVRDVAASSGNSIDADYVKSAVVFDQSTISELDLGPFDRERVVTIAQLQSVLQTRHDFAPNPGDIDSAKRAALVNALRAANATATADTSSSPWAVDHEAAAINQHAMTQAGRRVAASAAVVDAPKRRSTLGHNMWYLASRTMPLLLAAFAYWWVLYGGGMDMVIARVDGMTVPEDEAYSVTAADPTSHQVLDNVPGVVERMRKDAPAEVVAAIKNPDHPTIQRSTGGAIVYSWRYTDDNGVVKTYTVRTTIEGEILAPGSN